MSLSWIRPRSAATVFTSALGSATDRTRTAVTASLRSSRLRTSRPVRSATSYEHAGIRIRLSARSIAATARSHVPLDRRAPAARFHQRGNPSWSTVSLCRASTRTDSNANGCHDEDVVSMQTRTSKPSSLTTSIANPPSLFNRPCPHGIGRPGLATGPLVRCQDPTTTTLDAGRRSENPCGYAP